MPNPAASPAVSSTVGLKNMVLAPLTADTEEAITYGELQKVAGAIEASVSPENADPEVQRRLGVIQAQLGDLAAASTSLERAVALRPQSADFLYDLGVVYVKQARLDAAEECFRKGLALNPASEPNRRGLLKVQQLRTAPLGGTSQPTSPP